MTLILGIDPGLNNTGWGLVHCKSGVFKYVNCGTIVSHSKISTHLRLKKIYNHLDEIIKKESPTECAIEETFVNKNPRLSLKFSYSKAVAMLVAAQNNLKVFEYTPKAIKKAFAGTGKADKAQMTGMLKYLLPAHEVSSEHEADALALAICHINTESFNQALKKH